MSATVVTVRVLHCDAPGGCKEIVSRSNVRSLAELRIAASVDGWRSKGQSDYCPEHRNYVR